ncbi:MAG: PH domain-containing protein [Phycisphaerae bacterium]|nr:PH domain-containing protein [Phycisphaerae bacterium]MDW8261952.1 PH domain-containing protein [Phycisphaerales bacterium]
MRQHAQQAAEWIYRGVWGVLVQWFRVPDQPPTLPARPGEKVETFRPAEGFLKYLKFWFWLVVLVLDLGILGLWMAVFAADRVIGAILTPVALAAIIIPDVLAYLAIHLRYDTTWYVMSDRSLRIRRGIFSIHEVTITFENIQNVMLRQGPLQRYFGIADLEVQTAGGGSAGTAHGRSEDAGHTGLIEGIANAAELRDRIMARLRQSRTAGLGDEPAFGATTTHNPPSLWTAEHLALLREIREALCGDSSSVRG